MKEDVQDTTAALAEDQEFLANLKKSCATKTAEWEERSKTRSEELVALAETIKVLNDDDALDLFKKALPSAASSFVQVQGKSSTLRTQALAEIKQVLNLQRGPERVGLDLISLALRGKKIGFAKVIKMIDDMIATLHVEQQDDDKKKEYCGMQFDLSDDKKKALERKVSDAEASIQGAQEGSA